MHLHFERNSNAKCDCAILSLTWMGKVPDELPEDEGWKLNRTNYYQEGWLATGHIRGIVGVTFTTSHCKKSVDYPLRTNYNLRGHRSEVILVKWNEPYQKLASCDSSGIIFVWIKYEGRWSIELINDRNTPVTNFAWSHDGRMALICYQDGFVLVGSVAGQRYWSSMLSLESTITCGIWTPDDLQVYFGTSQGGLVVMDVHGAMVAQVSLAQAPVTSMAWSCEKFKMEEGDDNENTDNSTLVLAVSLSTGYIFLMKSYDDVSPIQFHTGLNGPLFMEWSNSKQLLAVAGVAAHNENKEYVNVLKCYTETGELLYSTSIPYSQSPVTALTWGHNDKRLFVATGGIVHIAWVSRRVASLQLLSRLKVASALSLGESSVQNLPLPPRIKHLIGNLFAQTIRCCVPETKGLREFVSRAPVNGTRLHCTMIKHGDENLSFGTYYTLYLEYLGGLVPLLKGKRTSKIRPEFVIFDPQVDGELKDVTLSNLKITAKNSDTSDTEREEGCSGSPRAQRKRRKRRRSLTDNDDDIPYADTLPEYARLAEVTSNIWGTKFKIHGLAECLPANLGQVTYKTSLLHLQPRQMSLIMTELSDDLRHAPDPSFNPKVFSEDEDEERNALMEKNFFQVSSGGPNGAAIPIAPMTPRREENRSRLLNSVLNKADGAGNNYLASPRLMYKNPSLPRERTEPRKPLINGFQNVNNVVSIPSTSYKQEEIKVFCSKENQDIAGPLDGSLSAAIRNENEILSSILSSKLQPSTISDWNIPKAYQNDRSREESQKKNGSQENSSKKQDLIDQESTDFNLIEINSFSENLKTGEIDNKRKATCLKFWQEKTETSFLNHQAPIKSSVKTQNPQSPKNTIAPCSLFSDIGGPNYTAPNTPIQSIQKMKNTLGKCINNEKLGEESRNVLDRMSRSCSVGYLDDVDTGLIPCPLTLKLLQKDSPKRLILVGDPRKNFSCKQPPGTKYVLKKCGKSKSLDSGELLLNNKSSNQSQKTKEFGELIKGSIESSKKKLAKETNEGSINERLNISAILLDDISNNIAPLSPKFPRSQPVTPAMSKKKRNLSSSPINRKHLLNSPLLRRRGKSKTESSDDDNAFSGDEAFTSSSHFKDLETFQKAQLRQKLKRGKVRDGSATPKVRELVMHNKAPMWNENSQVYQLDFGGRVTQESAKNFQIEFKGKQVMQFGRIDGNAYTLDFQYPFSVLQAFSVALANVTQRLK